MKRIVTINTDAGFWTHHKVGSFAYWIEGEEILLKGSGVFREKVKNSWDAEMKSIINALTLLDQSGYKNIHQLIINRDNINAVSGKYSDNDLKRHLSLVISRLRKRSGKSPALPFFKFMHVKAHVEITDQRTFINDWCDQQCKQQLQNWATKNKIPKYEKKETQNTKV